MKPNSLIHIQGADLQEVKSIVNKFCMGESGKGVKSSFHLQALGKNCHVLVFPKAIPFDLFCELLFKLDVLSEDKRKVRAYLNVEQKESGLPAESMIYVNATERSDFAAVDVKGNLYEDDAETEPYLFKPTGKRENYIPCSEVNAPSAGNLDMFHVTEEKASPLKRVYNKVQGVAGVRARVHPGACQQSSLYWFLVIACHCLFARKDGKLFLYLILAALVVELLPVAKNKYANRFATTLFALVLLAYIPNYHFPRYMEKRKAVIEKIHTEKGRHDSSSAWFRFENNETFKVSYKVNEELMHVGDTCILDIGKGLWGMKVCAREVTCNGKRIWGD